jgi:uncharacterized protein
VSSKIDLLRQYLAGLPNALVCFSGGIDSTLVLTVAQEQLGARTLAFTAISPSVAPTEREEALRIAENIGARHHLEETREMQREAYVRNAPDRCYHCKTELYQSAHRVAKETGITVILNGTNLDDLGDYRPGLEAAKEHAVRSPLAELGFTKAEVREAAKTLGLDTWDKPAAACLSSRIPYGTSVTVERLQQIAQLEAFLKDAGIRHVRVRHHDNLARVEVAPSDFTKLVEPAFAQALHRAGRAAGFIYVTLDLAGYRQGSHNETLSTAKRSLPLVPR